VSGVSFVGAFINGFARVWFAQPLILNGGALLSTRRLLRVVCLAGYALAAAKHLANAALFPMALAITNMSLALSRADSLSDKSRCASNNCS
jgi:hypothetical protein